MKGDVLFFWFVLVALLFFINLDAKAESEMPMDEVTTAILRDPHRPDNTNALQKRYDQAFNNCVSLNKDYIKQGHPLTELQFFTCMHIQGATL